MVMTLQQRDAIGVFCAEFAANFGYVMRRKLMAFAGHAIGSGRMPLTSCDKFICDCVGFIEQSLGVNEQSAKYIYYQARNHLYSITADARSIRQFLSNSSFTDLTHFSCVSPRMLSEMRKHEGPIIIATFHCASYYLALGYVSSVLLPGRGVAFIKAHPPSPSEKLLIEALKKNGIDAKFVILTESKQLNRRFFKSIKSENRILFHMCDTLPNAGRSLKVRWLGSEHNISCGIVDLSLLIDAPIFTMLYQSTSTRDIVRISDMFLPQQVAHDRHDVLQRICDAGEAQIRSCPEQWQLWHDWSYINSTSA